MRRAVLLGCSEPNKVSTAELKGWRRAERQRLLALRTRASMVDRRRWSLAIEAQLRVVIEQRQGIMIGAYWPFQAEFDPRPLIGWLVEQGSLVALPAVIDKNGPLEYRSWRPGEPLISGVWDIPVPRERNIVTPQAVLAPLVGFDRQCYRLGYGGGFFDRTLAALSPRPLAIGVGFELSRIETIQPQAFDIPMDMVVTEEKIRQR
jgi:5-formyltetrahydrofolate cyclo-ligase